MRLCFLAGFLCLGILLPGEEQDRQYVHYTYDGSGNRTGGRLISDSLAPGQTAKAERVHSINGRAVPLESVEEKVLRDDSAGRVVERLIRRYDQNGRPAGIEKVVIEELPRGANEKTVTTSVYRADLNGRLQLSERSTAHSTATDSVTETTTTVERPAAGRSLAVVEKQVAKEVHRDSVVNSDVTTYRRDGSGRFTAAARQTTEKVTEGNTTTETTVSYNTVNSTGRLEFAGQTVANTEKRPDGSETKVISIYGAAAPGRSATGYSAQPRLREQLIVEREARADGSTVEKTGVRRVSLANAGRLEDYQLVSEVVCTGACIPPPEEPAKAAEPAGPAPRQ